VLAELMALQITFAAVALDKRRIFDDGVLLYPGLQFRPTFFKFVHSKLFEPLYSRHHGLNVVADRIGSEEFMDSFRAYVDKRQRSLFVNPKFDFAVSRENVLVQNRRLHSGIARAHVRPKEILGASGGHPRPAPRESAVRDRLAEAVSQPPASALRRVVT
jgi:hypothetical protein